MKMSLSENTFPYEWFRTKTRFDTEAKDNLEMTYQGFKPRVIFENSLKIARAFTIQKNFQISRVV